MTLIPDPLLVVLLGPTASGKTALSLLLAERFGGEIISCDSIAVYREMDLGSAKPSLAERARVPHHLVDVAAPDQVYSAGEYSRAARTALREITARGRLAVISGGTGLYLRAMVDGLSELPPRSEDLRDRLRASEVRHASAAGFEAGGDTGQGSWLHRVLTRLDPAAAARIHANDQPKLIRAIEVSLTTRGPLSQAFSARREPLTGYRILRLGLDPARAALYERINQRAAQMFTDGLVEETRGLLERYGPPPGPASLQALGYRQAAACLAGELPLPEAIRLAQQGHRNYAKRQLTWFRREPETLWLRSFGDDPDVQQAVLGAVERAL